MEKFTDSLFDAQAPETPAALAAALAPPSTAGHYDELRGGAASAPAGAPAGRERTASERMPLTPAWTQFFTHLGLDGFDELNHRTANLHRQIRDNGVTYNVYADARRPAAALVAGPVSADHHAGQLAADRDRRGAAHAVARPRHGRRVRPADTCWPKACCRAALVQGHPGYLRSMHGVRPVGGTHLHIAAFDLARGPDGNWWVVSQRTQAPSGLGYLLENRLAISRLFPQAFEGMQVQRLAATYRALIEGHAADQPGWARPRTSRC